jgi:Ca2+-binding EF-hand superfamily protein
MPIKAAQRIAFKIYDRNGNGIIDEKDIIELLAIAD